MRAKNLCQKNESQIPMSEKFNSLFQKSFIKILHLPCWLYFQFQF